MKILIVIDDLRIGGTENVLANRISELQSEIDFTVLTLFDLGPVAQRIEKMGINVECLDMKNAGISKTFRRVKDIIRSESFDAAVCMRDVTRALFPKFLKKYIANVAMLWDSPKIFRSFRYYPAEWYQVKFSGATPYCSSNHIAEQLYKNYKLKNVHVIPNCYNHHTFNLQSYSTGKTKHNPLLIVSVGGARKEKNYPEILKIAKIVKEKEINFKWKIAGDDPDGHIQRDIIEMNLESEVVAAGRCQRIPELLKESDIFVCTSSSEGFPVAVLEAMASGVPCISYELPSLKEIDPNSENITTVAQNDHTDAAEKIIYLSEHPEEYAKLAKSASEHVSANFAADKNSRKWIEFITSK